MMLWAQITRLAVMCLNRESASWLHLPYGGGVMHQPYRTMQAFGIVQVVFSEKLKEEYNGKGKS